MRDLWHPLVLQAGRKAEKPNTLTAYSNLPIQHGVTKTLGHTQISLPSLLEIFAEKFTYKIKYEHPPFHSLSSQQYDTSHSGIQWTNYKELIMLMTKKKKKAMEQLQK